MNNRITFLWSSLSLIIFYSCAVSHGNMERKTAFHLNLTEGNFDITEVRRKASTIEWLAISRDDRCYECIGDDMVQDVRCSEVDCGASSTLMVSHDRDDRPLRSVPQKVGYEPLPPGLLSVPEPSWAGSIVYVDREDNATIPLEFKRVIVRNERAGFARARTVASVNRSKSDVRVFSNQGLQFIYRAESNEHDPKRVIQLLRFESDRNRRVKILVSATAYGASSVDPQNSLPFDATRFGESSYLITLSDGGPGEYGFSLGREESYEVHFFGIDRAESNHVVSTADVQPETLETPNVSKSDPVETEKVVRQTPPNPTIKNESAGSPQTHKRNTPNAQDPIKMDSVLSDPAILTTEIDTIESSSKHSDFFIEDQMKTAERTTEERIDPATNKDNVSEVITPEALKTSVSDRNIEKEDVNTTYYFIQLASLSSSQGNASAFRDASRYGTIFQFIKGNTTKIRLGAFDSRERVKSILVVMKRMGYTDAFITSDTFDPGSFRILID